MATKDERRPVDEIAEEILGICAFARDRGGRIYVYENGVYRPGGEKAIERAVIDVLTLHGERHHWTSHKGREVVVYITLQCRDLWQAPPATTLNLRNGLLDVATRVLHPHSSDHLSAVQLPVDFDSKATCPAWDSFISDVFPRDSQHLGYQIVALAMLPDRSQQYAVLLLGDGGNGKSTYLCGVVSFLGKENVTTLSLHQIEEEKFARAELHGKLANVCPDIPSSRLASTAIFKAITGGDMLTAEHKFKEPFLFTPFAKLIFSCNRPFPSNDDSAGFHQRWRVIPFARQLRGAAVEISRDELDTRLADPRELSGLLNKALDALAEVRKRGVDVTTSMRDAAKRFLRVVNPIAAWMDANTVNDPNGIIAKRKLIDAYNRGAARDGCSPVTDRAFGDEMRRSRPDVRSAQRRVRGQQKDVYVGLTMAHRAADRSKLVR